MSVASSRLIPETDTLIDPPEMTVEEFLTLPEDGIHRELIRGHVWEEGMTYRNRFHSSSEACIAFLLQNWLVQRPEPRGLVVSGEAGFRLCGPTESVVGIDVAYVSPELLAATGPKQLLFEGPPVLAVEILSESQTHGGMIEKIKAYHEVGTVVWVVDPDLRTVTVHQPGERPVMRNEAQELSGEPYLPGFRVPVARIFTT